MTYFEDYKRERATRAYRWENGLDLDIRPYEYLYHQTRKNAIVRNIPFELTRKDFEKMVRCSRGRCALSGLPFSFDLTGGRRPFAPSIDRIKSCDGYTAKNCRIVSVLANLALNTWGDTSLIEFCHAVSARYKRKEASEKRKRTNALKTKVVPNVVPEPSPKLAS